MKINEPVNKNYCAVVVKIEKLVPLANCANVQGAILFGNQVIVGNDTTLGTIGLFFPVECALSAEFLKHNNLNTSPELNADKKKKGYFSAHGRVKTQAFRKHRSEGFFIPLSSLDFIKHKPELKVGDEFDTIGSTLICKKYVVAGKERVVNVKGAKKAVKRVSRLLPDTFRHHIDTQKLDRNVYAVSPASIISLSRKLHGTSGVFANIPVKRKLNFIERALKYLGVKIADTEYDIVRSSRRVIKNSTLDDPKNKGTGFYKYDLWKDVADEIGGSIDKNVALYAEIVGFLPSGEAIQRGYSYNCAPNKYAVYLYRATLTNIDGKVVELNFKQLQAYAAKHSLNVVPEVYYGAAKDLFPDIAVDDNWHTNFLQRIKEELVEGKMCEMNNYSAPAEGICLRLENELDTITTFKVKSFLFRSYESKLNDEEYISIEDEQSILEEDV